MGQEKRSRMWRQESMRAPLSFAHSDLQHRKEKVLNFVKYYWIKSEESDFLNFVWNNENWIIIKRAPSLFQKFWRHFRKIDACTYIVYIHFFITAGKLCLQQALPTRSTLTCFVSITRKKIKKSHDSARPMHSNICVLVKQKRGTIMEKFFNKIIIGFSNT